MKQAERKTTVEEKKLYDQLAKAWNGMTDEQKEKARACKTAEELIAFAGKEGVELPDEALDEVSAGYTIPKYPGCW